MSRRGVWRLLVVLGVLAVSCGSGAGESSTPVATTLVPTPTTDATTGTEPASDGQEVEAYLVEMTNLAADVDAEVAEFEQAHFEETVHPFVEPGEEQPPQTLPPEGELFEDEQTYWLGYFNLHVAHADVLDAVDVPEDFESAHQGYVNSYREYFTYVRDQVASFTTLAEFQAFFGSVFDPLVEQPPEHDRLFLALVENCESLDMLGTDAAYRSDLGCPAPPPEPVSIHVEIRDQWSATPNPLPVGDGLVQVTITNTGAEPIRPVVLENLEGDPLDLPLVEGVVDISRDGEFEFRIAYPGPEVHPGEEPVLGEPPELLPGESVEAVIWSEGTMVVFDYQPGEFEAGAYVVVERSGT